MSKRKQSDAARAAKAAQSAKARLEALDFVSASALPILQEAYKKSGHDLVKTGPDCFDALSQTGTKVRSRMTFRQASEYFNNNFK